MWRTKTMEREDGRATEPSELQPIWVVPVLACCLSALVVVLAALIW